MIAHLSILRAYHQVQEWIGNKLDPKQWGWKIYKGKLFPIYSSKAPAPEKLLKMVRCTCKTDCSRKNCTCFNYGIECSDVCKHCRGISCLNILKQNITEENDDDDDDVFDELQ